MRAPEDKPDPTYKSPMEKYGKHLRAIGVITVENSSLELLFADLLGLLLGINNDAAIALFYSPKAAIARLDMLSNVLPIVLKNNKQLRTRIEKLIDRAKSVIGKRHELIHALWAENEVPGEPVVTRITFPKWGGGPIAITELYQIIKTYRRLIQDMLELFYDLQPLSKEDEEFFKSGEPASEKTPKRPKQRVP